MAQLWAYTDDDSYEPDQLVKCFVRYERSLELEGSSNLVVRANIQVFRIGAQRVLKLEIPLFTVQEADRSPDYVRTVQTGCGWDTGFEFTVEPNWESGIYEIVLTSAPESPDSAAEERVLFVVRPPRNGDPKPILVHIPTATAQAYNGWGQTDGNPGLYWLRFDGIAMSTNERVSYDRPYEKQKLENWCLPFIQWLEGKGLLADYCSSIDLHSLGGQLLQNGGSRQLFVSVAHDEYWSHEMRDHVEAFIENGGNAAFFGANTCWWLVRFEPPNPPDERRPRRIVCYKRAENLHRADPHPDARLQTTHWWLPGPSRPEDQMTGASFMHGTYSGERYAYLGCAYKVRAADHDLFKGTGLNADATFGRNRLGYETDAVPIVDETGDVVVEELGGSVVIQPKPRRGDVIGPPYENATPECLLVLADMWVPPVKYKSLWRHRATMTIHRVPGGGTVFNAGTLNWIRNPDGIPKDPGLANDAVMEKITRNVIDTFTMPRPRSPVIANAGFELGCVWDALSSELTATLVPQFWHVGDSTVREVGGEVKVMGGCRPGSKGHERLYMKGPVWLWTKVAELEEAAGRWLCVSAWIKSYWIAAKIGVAWISVQKLNGDWVEIARGEYRWGASDIWHCVRAHARLPDEIADLRVVVGASDGVEAYFDDVRLEIL